MVGPLIENCTAWLLMILKNLHANVLTHLAMHFLRVVKAKATPGQPLTFISVKLFTWG